MHRHERAEQGVEETLGEVREWFDDALDFFGAVGCNHVGAGNLADVVEELKDDLMPLQRLDD
jgi:hypothetical protein